MTGKQLKEWANTVPDEATVSVRERCYGAWEERFDMQATLTLKKMVEQSEESS